MSTNFRPSDQLLMPWSPKYTVSAKRVAEMLDVSDSTVMRMIEDGTLKAYQVRKIQGSPWRINYESVIAYIESIHKDNDLEQRF